MFVSLRAVRPAIEGCSTHSQDMSQLLKSEIRTLIPSAVVPSPSAHTSGAYSKSRRGDQGQGEPCQGQDEMRQLSESAQTAHPPILLAASAKSCPLDIPSNYLNPSLSPRYEDWTGLDIY